MYHSLLSGKIVSKLAKTFKLGTGSTWPGHVALKADSKLIKKITKKNPNLKIILVAGTNGKTTTAKLIQEALEQQNKRVFRNDTGANLLNGIASTLIKHSNLAGKISYDAAIFEVDENTLPIALSQLSTTAPQLSIILLNLFRDQLDRYGELNSIAKHWLVSLKNLPKDTILVTNGDDPMLRFLGENSNLHTYYFGLSENLMKETQAGHDVDFLYCPNCQTKLIFKKRSYSHMGIYNCPSCKFAHKNCAVFGNLPNPLLGIFNIYNINAATLLLQKGFGISEESVKKTLIKFSPAFGRQEIIEYKGKNVFLLLSKNPTGFNQSIQAILGQDKNPNILILLNDRIPDGRDVSWIWDVEFEELVKAKFITISGDRAYDMGLRIKYCEISNSKFRIVENLQEALITSISKLNNETLYVLATYSAMLEVRKILKGRKIL